MSHCATLFASLSRMKSPGWARKCLLAFGLVVSAACGAGADRARDIPITSVPYGNNKVGNYYTVFGGSETLITASAVHSLLNREAREYRLDSEQNLPDEESIELPDKTSWSATYWLYRAQQRNFLFVADKKNYPKETVLGAQMDTGHKADAEIRQWREDTLDQIDAHCASRTTASSFQIRDSMNAVELLGLQLECQESLFRDLGEQYSGEDIETLSNNLDAAVLDFYGHTAWHTEEHTAWRTENCDGLETTTQPTSTTLYDEHGEDFSTAHPFLQYSRARTKPAQSPYGSCGKRTLRTYCSRGNATAGEKPIRSARPFSFATRRETLGKERRERSAITRRPALNP